MRNDNFDTAEMIKRLESQLSDLRDDREARGTETNAHSISYIEDSDSTDTVVVENEHQILDGWEWSGNMWGVEPW